jgi:hypothetical protein
MHAGLHRPDVLTHFSRVCYTLSQEEIREAVKVWCCAYITIEGIATAHGQPPDVLTDRTIEQASAASNPYCLPGSLHQAVILQLFCTRVHTAMYDLNRLDSLASQQARGSLIKSFEYELGQQENHALFQTGGKITMYFLF